MAEVSRRWRASIGTSPGEYGFGLGFELPEVFEGAVDGEAGSVEAVLEAGERLIAVLEGLGGCVVVVGIVPAGFLGGEFPEVGIRTAEAAKGPLAEDEVVEEEASLRGSGAVVFVIFGFEPIEGFGLFPREDFGFGVDTGLEVGGDDASLTFRGGGAAGFAAVEAGGGDLLFGTHEKTLLQENRAGPEADPGTSLRFEPSRRFWRWASGTPISD
jgi:hypothetical protein